MKLPTIELKQRGSKGVWWVRYFFNGERPHYSLGTVDKAEALEEAARIRYEIKHGIHRPQKRMIFDKLIKKYLKWAKSNKKENSYERDLVSLKPLLAFFGGKRIDWITLYQAEQYKIQRVDGTLQVEGVSRKKKLAKSTVNKEIMFFKHMFNKAVEWSFLDKSPLRYLKLYREFPRTRYVKPDEWPQLVRCCTPEMRDIVIFARNTGMRRSEIFNFKWEDIDWRQKSFDIIKCKNNQPRTLVMNQVVYKILLRRKKTANSCYVFPGKDDKKRKTIRRGFKAACRRADIKDLRFHDLRHTFASDLVNREIKLATIANLMGHKRIVTTMRYAHLYKRHLREAMEGDFGQDESGPIWDQNEV